MSTVAQLNSSLTDIIQPRWWTGTPAISPKLFTIDCSEYQLEDSMLQPDGELGHRMLDIFHRMGVVHLTHTGFEDLQLMRRAAKLIVEREITYAGGANPRGNLEANVYEVGAPLVAHLQYHHEMAYVGISTKMLAFLCGHAQPGAGYTYLSDNMQVTDALLNTEFGQKLKRLGLCYHRNLTDRRSFVESEEIGVYNHWQMSMLTEDPDEAITMARSRGLECEWGPDGMLKTRYYISAFEYFPQLDKNVLYSSLADDGMWFDTWPKIMHLPNHERPLKLTFGDGAEMTREEKELFIDVYDRFGIPIPWQQGDVAVVCNYRFAHGRPSVHLNPGERRELGVLIGESFDRVGALENKW